MCFGQQCPHAFRQLNTPAQPLKQPGLALVCTDADALAQLRTAADYFETHAERMRYPTFRKQDLFLGSGVIEAGCNTVIGSRLKQSGMFWTVRGANAILALRCSHLNGRFDYWESRRAA